MPVANSIVLTQNSTTVTGYQTSFEGADGDLLVAKGISVPILQVNSSTSLILKSGWPGTTTSDVTGWQIALTSPYWNDAVGAFSKVNELLDRLAAGMPFEPDYVGPFSDRAQFNDAAPPFIFLAMTPAPAKLYFKTGTGPTDWSDPIQIQSSAVGQDAVITGASASVLPEGATPTVTLGGTPGARTFAFGIPTGPRGLPNTLSVGNVTSGVPAASIRGTAPNQIVDFTFAQGGTGAAGPVGGNYFQDRAAAVLATSIPVEAKHIQTGCFDINRSSRRGGATYARLPSAPGEGLQPTAGVIHAVNDANAQPGGSWWIIQARQGGVEFDQLGCVPGTFNDYETGKTQNTAAFLAYEELVLETYYSDVKVLYVNPSWYAFADTIVLKRVALAIVGQNTANEWYKTIFAVPFHKDGIIIHYGNTKGNSVLTQDLDLPGNGSGAGGSRLEGISLFGNTGSNHDMTAISDGILLRARAYMRNVFVGNFSRHGIHVMTSSSAASDNPGGQGMGFPAGNANNVRIHDSTVQWCGGTGIRIAGPDSNACSVMDCEANYCGYFGFQDVSFLGPNGLYNFHTTDNGVGFSSTPTHGYVGIGNKSGGAVTYDDGTGLKTYIAVVAGDFTDLPASYIRYCTTVPGTDQYTWEFYGNGDAGVCKPWLPNQPQGTYMPCGSLCVAGVNLRTAVIASYHEGTQPPAQFRSLDSAYLGSLTASNMTQSSYGFIDHEREQRTIHPYVNRYVRDNVWHQNKLTVVYENDVGTPTVNWSKCTQYSLELYDSFEGDNRVTRYHVPGTPNFARLSAIAGGDSSGLASDNSGQAPDLGMQMLTRLALANPLPTSWIIQRLLSRMNQDLVNTRLGTGDIVFYNRRQDLDPFDAGALIPGGWVGRVIQTGGDAGDAKTWANFGQIELKYQTVVSIPTLAPGASSGWIEWAPTSSSIIVSDQCDLTIYPDQSSGPVGNVHIEVNVVPQPFGAVKFNVRNTGTASITLTNANLVLRVRK